MIVQTHGNRLFVRAVVLAALAAVTFFPVRLALAEAPASGENEPAGALVICGGGKLPASIFDRFLELAGGQNARIVVIPTASVLADQTPRETLTSTWKKSLGVEVSLLHCRDRQKAGDPGLLAPLENATGVWIMGGNQSRLAEAYLGTPVEEELLKLHRRGGVIGGTSAGAAIMSRRMIAGGKQQPLMGVGFDLLPGAVIDQHFLRRNRQERLKAAVERHNDCFGLGIDEGAAVVVRSGRLEVIGESTATVCLPAHAERRMFEIRPGQSAPLPELYSVLVSRQASAGD